MRKPIIAATGLLFSVAGLVGVAQAGGNSRIDYPPTTSVGQEGPTTTITGGGGPTTTGNIPETGGDSSTAITLGLTALAAGTGLVLVTVRRRRVHA